MVQRRAQAGLCLRRTRMPQGSKVCSWLMFFSFFAFKHMGITYPCALIHWFSMVGDSPDDETGMWMVEPDFLRGKQVLEVIHLDSILRGAHLIGVSGSHFLPSDLVFNFSRSLDAFKTFYVNKYVDHHAHEIVF